MGSEARGISDCGFRIADFKTTRSLVADVDCTDWVSNPNSEFRNPQSKDGGGAENRTRIQEPTPKESTCLVASLACPAILVAGQKFAQCRVSEPTRPRQKLARLNLTQPHGPKGWASSSK